MSELIPESGLSEVWDDYRRGIPSQKPVEVHVQTQHSASDGLTETEEVTRALAEPYRVDIVIRRSEVEPDRTLYFFGVYRESGRHEARIYRRSSLDAAIRQAEDMLSGLLQEAVHVTITDTINDETSYWTLTVREDDDRTLHLPYLLSEA